MEETKKEEEKKEEDKKEENKNDLLEVPVKKIAEEVGIKNLIDDSYLLSTEKTWDELGVKDNIKKGLIEMDFISPSKVQSTTFPLIMKEPRINIIAQAKNGSGKTGAFGLGVISSIDENLNSLQAVVFAHTRELVIQIKDVLSKMAKFTNLKVQALLSGEDQPKEIGHIIVITPGHFENCFLKRDKDKLKNLKILVLDEADYMLTNDVTSKVCDRSFKLFQKEKMNVQILFFSATFDEKCCRFFKKFYENAHMIQLQKEELTLDNVKQYYQECKTEDDKVQFIVDYLKVSHGSSRVIIFANRRDYVVKLQKKLFERGYKVFILMGGDMDRNSRDETIKKFREGKIQILITTDLLSRGYDERLVRLVINFDLPVKGPIGIEPNYETYLHRIGRAGRFGTQGIGVNLCCGKNDLEIIKNIEKYYKTKIEKMQTLDELLEELKNFYLDKF
jgi:ATP-dependent RNA helicase DDX19/DBP5